MSFKKNKYTVIRQAISKDLAAFVANYFLMQKQVYDTCRERRYFSPFETIIGTIRKWLLQKPVVSYSKQTSSNQYR